MENKKSKKPLIITITILLSFILVIGCICIILFTPLFKSPKQKLVMAATKTFYSEPSKLYGSDGILLLTLFAGGEFDYSTEFSLDKLKIEEDAFGIYKDNSYKMISGLYIGQDGYLNIPDRQSFITTTVRYNAFRLTEADVFVDDSDIYMTDSHLMDGNLYLNTESFGEDYKDSIYSEYICSLPMVGTSLDSDLGDLSFNIYDSLESLQKYVSRLTFKKGSGGYTTIKNIYEDAEVTITGVTKEYEVAGKRTKCQEYKVVIPYDILEEIDLPANLDWSDYLGDDFEFYVYIDKNYRIVAITHEYELAINDLPDISYELEVVFSGEKYLLSDIGVSLIVINEDSDQSIIESEANYSYQPDSKEFMLTASINDNTISTEGSLETSIDSFTLDTEDIEVNINTSLLTGTISCSGSFSMNRPDDDVPTLSGKDYVIMDMTEDDWKELISTIANNIFPF